jgi:predicted dehydrogenase
MTTADNAAEPLRVGILGAARIADLAIVKPARLTGVRLVAVAARDRSRAEAFAEKNGVERALNTYQDVIDDPEVEAIYNPLANSLHPVWNVAALRAGKHVLTEKPSAGTAEQARSVRAVVEGTGLTFMEGFHYYYHPLIGRLKEILAGGEIGEVVDIESSLAMPAPADDDLRWQFDLAGGALMDLGCYALHSQRMLAEFGGGEPTVVNAKASERKGHPGVDEWLTAELVYPSGLTGTASCDMTADSVDMHLRVVGTHGEALIPDFVNVHVDDRLLVTTNNGSRTEHPGHRSSYSYQLEAFIRAVRGGPAPVTDAADAVATMALIDTCYQAASLPLRPTHD